MKNKTVTIFSYPKSGKMWTSVFLGVYYGMLKGMDIDINSDINELSKNDSTVAGIKFTHNLHTNFYGVNAVLLFRDLRDSIVSWYHFCKYRLHTYEGSIDTFIRDSTEKVHTKYPYYGGIDTPIKYYNNIYRNKVNFTNFIFIRYENLGKQSIQDNDFAKLLKFIGVEIDANIFYKALEYCSFDNMQKKEATGELSRRGFNKKYVKDGEINTLHCRKGKSGEYKNILSQESIDFLNRSIEQKLNPDLKCSTHQR